MWIFVANSLPGDVQEKDILCINNKYRNNSVDEELWHHLGMYPDLAQLQTLHDCV